MVQYRRYRYEILTTSIVYYVPSVFIRIGSSESSVSITISAAAPSFVASRIFSPNEQPPRRTRPIHLPRLTELILSKLVIIALKHLISLPAEKEVTESLPNRCHKQDEFSRKHLPLKLFRNGKLLHEIFSQGLRQIRRRKFHLQIFSVICWNVWSADRNKIFRAR